MMVFRTAQRILPTAILKPINPILASNSITANLASHYLEVVLGQM